MKKHWYNNGIVEKYCEECPENFVLGRAKHKLTPAQQINKELLEQILLTKTAEEINQFYYEHSKEETAVWLGLTKDKIFLLRTLLKNTGYDFNQHKVSPFKGKKSPRSHESYVKGGEKSSSTQKADWEQKSKEERQAWSLKMSESHLTESFREIKTKQNREKWFSRTDEEKAAINKKRSDTMKSHVQGLSTEEKADWVARSFKQYIYEGEYFDSFPELCFYLYNRVTGRNIIRSKQQLAYDYLGEQHVYLPDFELDGEFYEIKGDHLYKQLLIENTIDYAKYQCMLQNNVHILTSEQYKYYETWFYEAGFKKETFQNK